jgi:predicted lipoprotein with Yx(FWY)xxD motif
MPTFKGALAMKPSTPSSGRRRLAGAGSVALLVVVAAVLALAGSASSKAPTLSVAKAVQVNSRSESIAVTPRGAAVYQLSPETARHLLCTSRQCLSFWPPVKVAKGAKLTKGAGLKGRLGTLKRAAFTQLTLNGHPLYTFSEDKGRRGEAHGDGLRTFGGTWHVFRETGAGSSKTINRPAPTSSTSTAPYGY